MRTFLYNTVTNEREGPIRDGRYLVDGKPGKLPPELIELEIVSLPAPSYNPKTHTIEEVEYMDIEKKQWVRGYNLVELAQEEPSDSTPIIDIPKIPQSCSMMQFRLALIKHGISLSLIAAEINKIENLVEKETLLTMWEYADIIYRNSELVDNIIETNSLTSDQMNEIFISANKILFIA